MPAPTWLMNLDYAAGAPPSGLVSLVLVVAQAGSLGPQAVDVRPLPRITAETTDARPVAVEAAWRELVAEASSGAPVASDATAQEGLVLAAAQADSSTPAAVEVVEGGVQAELVSGAPVVEASRPEPQAELAEGRPMTQVDGE